MPREKFDVPGDLKRALKGEAKAVFNALAPSHKRRYVDWIDGAKKDETRKRRIARAIEMIMEKNRDEG
jgi:uncharacterized protein YdeI (YjbR/CyaY-like superfamily)